jgi:hypothetical protein
MEVTLNLPENIYRNFTKLAEKKHRRIEEIITDKLQNNYSFDENDFEETVANLSDEEVLALANLKLPKEFSNRISELSDRVQRGIINKSEENELAVYTEMCQISTLRKAYGISEAVKRKLISSPNDLK